MPPDLEGYGPLSSRASWAKRSLIAVVVLNAVSIISAYFAYQTYSADIITHKRAAAVAMVVGAVEVVAGILAVLVVQRTTHRQEARAARLAQPEPASPVF